MAVIKKVGRRNLLQPHSEYIFTKRSLFVLLAKITKHPQWKVRAERRLMFGQDDESVIDDKRYIVPLLYAKVQTNAFLPFISSAKVCWNEKGWTIGPSHFNYNTFLTSS